jgi:hypothetical protein
MPYTVRLVEDATGWFATLRAPWPMRPEARVRWESVFEVEAHAKSVLGLADLLAKRLTDGTCSWRAGGPGDVREGAGRGTGAMMDAGTPSAMRFDVYGLFELEVRRIADGWAVWRVGEGRFRESGIVIPSDVPAEDVERYLDDLFHEGARDGRRLRRVG